MDRIEATYQAQLDLKSYPTTQLQNLASRLRLPVDLAEDDLAWVIAATLLDKYRKAKMPPKIEWGRYTGQLQQLNLRHNNIAKKFSDFAEEAGIGGKEERMFNGEAFVQYAIDNNITNRPADKIYEHMIMSKLQEDLVEAREQFPKSLSGKQCTTQCYRDRHNNCTCQTESYQGWWDTFTWDYCNLKDCATRTIDI